MVTASVRGHSASGEQLELLFNEVLEYEIAQVSQPASQPADALERPTRP